MAGSEELAYRCMFDICCFILSHLKMKRQFAGKCIHIINVMQRYTSSTRVQTTGCLIIDKLALNETLRPELGASASVIVRLLRELASDDSIDSTSADASPGSRTSLLFHVMGAMSSLSLECPSNVHALHELGAAGALLDAIKPHFYAASGREAHMTSAFLTCVSSLASQSADMRDLFCCLGCCRMVKEAVVGREDDARVIRQASSCVVALLQGNAANVEYFKPEGDFLELIRRSGSAMADNYSVAVATRAAVQAVEEAVDMASGQHGT